MLALTSEGQLIPDIFSLPSVNKSTLSNLSATQFDPEPSVKEIS